MTAAASPSPINLNPAALTVGAIEQLDRETLVQIWTQKLGLILPKNTATSLLKRAIAFEAQAKQLGDLTKLERRAFQRAAHQRQKQPKGTCHEAVTDNRAASPDRAVAGASAQSAIAHPLTKSSDCLKPGAVLLREWNGRTYEVRCVEAGFEFDGATYKSLSKIARRITGAHWSGPRFFGLVKAPASNKAATAKMAS